MSLCFLINFVIYLFGYMLIKRNLFMLLEDMESSGNFAIWLILTYMNKIYFWFLPVKAFRFFFKCKIYSFYLWTDTGAWVLQLTKLLCAVSYYWWRMGLVQQDVEVTYYFPKRFFILWFYVIFICLPTLLWCACKIG